MTVVLQALPPHDLDAEAAVVASILADDRVLPRVAGVTAPDDFFRETHGLIYAAALACWRRGEPTNSIMVASELGQRGQLDLVGGPQALADFTTDLPTTIGVEHWAGVVARAAGYRRLVSAAGRIAQLGFAGGSDFEAALGESLALLRTAGGGLAGAKWESIADVVEREWPAIVERLTNPDARRGISTLWPSLDRILYGGGLLPGWLYSWLAQTSVGKSTTGRTLLRNIALSGTHCALFTLEQSRSVSAEQILFGMAGINGHYHESTGKPVSAAQLAALEAARERVRAHLGRLHVRDDAGITPGAVRLALTELCARYPVRVVVIDYLHRMRPDQPSRRQNEAADFAGIATALADVARELDLAVVLFAQVNRNNLGRARGGTSDEDALKPTVGDLRWSGDVENVSNCILSLHRRQWYVQRGYLKPKPGTEQDLEISVLKQQIGPAGLSATLHFDGARATVEDRDGWLRESEANGRVAG